MIDRWWYCCPYGWRPGGAITFGDDLPLSLSVMFLMEGGEGRSYHYIILVVILFVRYCPLHSPPPHYLLFPWPRYSILFDLVYAIIPGLKWHSHYLYIYSFIYFDLFVVICIVVVVICWWWCYRWTDNTHSFDIFTYDPIPIYLRYSLPGPSTVFSGIYLPVFTVPWPLPPSPIIISFTFLLLPLHSLLWPLYEPHLHLFAGPRWEICCCCWGPVLIHSNHRHFTFLYHISSLTRIHTSFSVVLFPDHIWEVIWVIPSFWHFTLLSTFDPLCMGGGRWQWEVVPGLTTSRFVHIHISWSGGGGGTICECCTFHVLFTFYIWPPRYICALSPVAFTFLSSSFWFTSTHLHLYICPSGSPHSCCYVDLCVGGWAFTWVQNRWNTPLLHLFVALSFVVPLRQGYLHLFVVPFICLWRPLMHFAPHCPSSTHTSL